MPSLPLLKALGLNFSPNQLEVTPGSLVEASNVIIRRDNVIESRRGYALYGTAMGSSSDRCKQLLSYKNKLIRHFSDRLQYENGLNNAGVTSFFDFNEIVSGSSVQATISEAKSGLRIKGIEANSNLYITTSEGIKKVSAKSADAFGAVEIVSAGGVKALDAEASLVTQIGDQSSFLPANSGVAYKIVWGTKDANNNLILGTPSDAVTILNPLVDLTLQDLSNFLLQLDNTTNAGSSLLTDTNYYTTFALPLTATSVELRDNLILFAKKIDEDLLFATTTGTGSAYQQLAIGSASVSSGTITVNFSSGNATNYFISGDKINIPTGFVSNSVLIDSINTDQVITSVTSGSIQFVAKNYALNNPAGISGTITNVATVPAQGSGICTLTCNSHGLKNNQQITITGSNSVPSINGTYPITYLSNNTFSIDLKQAFTASNGSSDISCVGHGYVAGDTVSFSTGSPAPVVAGTTYYVVSAGLTANSFRVSATPSGSAISFTAAGSGSVAKVITAAGTSALWNINVVVDSAAKIESYEFRSIELPVEQSVPATAAEVVSVKDYYLSILIALQDFIAARGSNIVASSVYEEYLESLDSTTAASVKLKITIPSSVLQYTSATNPYFYQIYRTDIAVVEGVSTISDIAIIQEYTQIEEKFPNASELSIGVVEFVDNTPESIAGTGPNLYTNERSEEGGLQANDLPPFALDINLFRGHLFYSNTRTRQRKTLTLLGVESMKSAFNPSDPYKITISNGTDSETYSFVTGLEEITQLTCGAASSLASTGTSSYFFLNSANDETQYYVWYQRGASVDPVISGKTGIKVVVLASDSAIAVKQKTINAIKNVLSDFNAFTSVSISSVDTSADLFNSIAHGLLNGTLIQFFSTGALPTYTDGTNTNIPLNGSYYVVNTAANTFQISLTSGGTPLNLDSIGSGTIKATGNSTTSVECLIYNTTSGFSTNALIGTLPVGFSLLTLQEGRGEDALSNQVLLSSNISVSIAIEETAKSFIRVINENASSFINAFYISGTNTTPGTILLESKELDLDEFYILGSDSTIGASFNPEISPGTIAINSISIANPTVITTLNHNFLPADVNTGSDVITILSHGFLESSKIIFSSTGTLPSPLVAGTTYYVKNATANSFQVSTAPGSGVIDLTTSGTGTFNVATPHELLNSTKIIITNSNSIPSINGVYQITYLSPTSFSIPVNVTGAGAAAVFEPILNAEGSSNEEQPHRVYYSKFQQPEAVPILNYLDVGATDKAILRIFPLRDSLFVFKEDGLFRVSGEVAPFSVALFDSSCILIAPDSVAVSNNQIYGWTTQGISTITEAGVNIISRPIDTEVLKKASSQFASFKTATWGVGYESDNSYTVYTVDKTTDTNATIGFRYSNLTNSWTTVDKSYTAGLVNPADDKLYLGAGDSNYLEKERKEFTRYDYADKELSFAILPNALSSNTIVLPTVSGLSVGDVVVQDQTLTVYEFNALLQKLDIDPGVNDTDYYATLAAQAGDDMRAKLEALATKLDSDVTSGYLAQIASSTGSVTSASIANPTLITTAANHNLQSGRKITISGNSASEVNGNFIVTVVSSNTFTIPVDLLSVGSGGNFSTTDDDFTDLKTCYNLIIARLNSDPIVAYSNYRPIDNNTIQEAIITSISTSSKTITLNLSLEYIQGALSIFKAIACRFTYSPITMGDPLGLKHVREATMMFANKAFTAAELNFSTDLLPEQLSISFDGDGNGIFGHQSFGSGFFGGASNAAPFRTFIPRQCQRCRYMNVGFKHQTAREQFAIYGITLTGEVGQSTRAYR